MEIHQLRYVCAVADTGSFTRAAEREKVAQPSLSQQIIELEQELGVRLFDRLGRGVRTTDAGQIFVTRVRLILKELNAAKEDVSAKQLGRSGPISVGVISSIAPYFLPPRLKSFCAKYPNASITVFEEASPRLLERLRSGLLDLAVMALPIASPEVDCVPLHADRLLAVFPADHKLATQPRVLLHDLHNEPFLLLRDYHCSRGMAIDICRETRMAPRIIFESAQFTSVLAMVGAGMGISIVPEIALERRPGCSFVPLGDEGAMRTIGIVVLKQHSLTALQRAFLDHLKNWTRAEGIVFHPKADKNNSKTQ